MMTYILLRNNKESGPYSLEGLREAGLGPGDLVWVEGQSVCWLPPSEIQELKSMIAAAAKKSALTVSAEKPVDKAVSGAFEKKKTPVSIPVPEKKTALNNGEYSAYQPLPETATTVPLIPLSAAKEEAAVAETKYSRPLDELKEMYARDLEKRLRKKSISLQVTPAVKKAGLYIAFLAVGLITGFLIRNAGKDSKEVGSAFKSEPVEAKTPAANPVTVNDETVTVPEKVIPNNAGLAQSPVEPPDAVHEIPPVTKERPVKKTGTAGETAPDPNATDKTLPFKTVAEPATRETVVRGASKNATADLATMVSVKSNDYLVGSFGGIKNLQLTVTNTSEYKLERVTVELQYLKPRDEFLKAENIVFNSIAPGGSLTLAIPKSSRGVNVRYRVIRIESDEVSGNTAGN